jgi:DNA-binding MarR family transcriptional regulator
MPAEQEVTEIAAALYLSVGLFKRRLRQLPAPGELSLPESSALRKLERGGPATVSALARAEQISAQSMGATLITLEARGLVSRQADPADGRRSVMSVTAAGLSALSDKRNARIAQLAQALTAGFSAEEMSQLMVAAPLIERLAENI